MSSFITPPRSRPLADAPFGPIPSLAAGGDSQIIDERLKSMRELLSGAASRVATVRDTDARGLPLPDQIAAKKGSFKRMVAEIAMHLDPGWRSTLLQTIERLLDEDDWDPEFRLPSEQSFSTFLRMIIYLRPTKRPGVGLSPRGHFLAAWTRGTDRLIIESIGGDEVRWVISRVVNGDHETGAGTVLVHRVPDVTAPYDPEPLFNNGEKLLA